MSRKSKKRNAAHRAAMAAKKSAASQNSAKEISANTPPTGSEDNFTPSSEKGLKEIVPRYPDPDKGYQPLTDYLTGQLTNMVIKYMQEIYSQRKIPIARDYWKRCTRTILGQLSTEEAIIIPAPAGAGKSTWIEAFTKAIVEQFQIDPTLSTSLVGIAVVLQKVEDLNRLANVLNADTPEDKPNMVALQGWTQSGQQQGFCRNTSVKRFEECSPSDCPYAQHCKLLTFKNYAPIAPVVGLTQERFAMLRDSGNLDTVLNRMVESNVYLPRRFLIFDEKFRFTKINTLNKDTIDHASLELTELIAKRDATDWRIRSLQRQLSYLVDYPFQKLRGSLRASTPEGDKDTLAGFCSLDAIELHQKIQYVQFRDFIDDKPQYATRHLREALDVMDGLHAGRECLFSKTNGFAITDIVPPTVTFGQAQTIIFDATAEVDDDYRSLENVQFFEGVPDRETCRVEYYIFTHKELNVSRSAMMAPWKIEAFSQLIAELAVPEDMFICTYKSFAEPFVDELKEALSPEQFQHILLKENCERPTLPYLGGTNGSNNFNTARQVFMLGYPRLNPRDYLINACAAYGPKQIHQELDNIPQEQLLSKEHSVLFSLPSMQRYIDHHLAARLEQEIYRCALRNPNFRDKIRIYLFCPPESMLRILLERIPGEVIYQRELPACVQVCKDRARRYKDSDTSFSKLVGFLNSWDGSRITVSALRGQLNISPAVWKDLLVDQRIKQLVEKRGVQRTGRGPNAQWSITMTDCA